MKVDLHGLASKIQFISNSQHHTPWAAIGTRGGHSSWIEFLFGEIYIKVCNRTAINRALQLTQGEIIYVNDNERATLKISLENQDQIVVLVWISHQLVSISQQFF